MCICAALENVFYKNYPLWFARCAARDQLVFLIFGKNSPRQARIEFLIHRLQALFYAKNNQ